MHIKGATASASFFFFNDTATTEIYTLSLHDALPISLAGHADLAHHYGLSPLARGHLPRDARRERSEEHTSELQSQSNLVCRLLLEKKKMAPSNVIRSEPRHLTLAQPQLTSTSLRERT